VKSELWRISKLSDKPQYLWNDAAVRWLKEQSHKATAGEDVTKLRWLHAHLSGKPLAVINRALIDRVTEAKLALGVSNARQTGRWSWCARSCASAPTNGSGWSVRRKFACSRNRCGAFDSCAMRKRSG